MGPPGPMGFNGSDGATGPEGPMGLDVNTIIVCCIVINKLHR